MYKTPLAGQKFIERLPRLGLWASLNKGLSGGGYGPLVCGGQLLAGMNEKEAIGITSLAEGLVCVVDVTIFPKQ